MENCIFCKIANGEIPAATLYEDENFRVILDLGPASKGHALILPKSHAANIYELSDEMAAKAMILAKKMATAMTAAAMIVEIPSAAVTAAVGEVMETIDPLARKSYNLQYS